MRCVATLLAATALSLPLAARAQAQASGPAWTLSQEMRIDAAAENLSDVNWVAVSRSGIIAIEQPKDKQVLFFNGAGKRIGVFGRGGEGPGEFRSMATIGWVGDTLWVNDNSLRRTTFISPQLKLLRDVPAGMIVRTAKGDTVGLDEGVGLLPAAVYGDGSILTDLIRARNTPQPTWYPMALDRTPYLVTSPVGVLQRFVGYVPPSTDCSAHYGRGSSYAVNPYCARSVSASAPDGSRIAIIAQANPTSATAIYTVTMLSSRGDTIYSRRFTTPSVVLPKHYTDSVMEMVSRHESPEAQAARRTLPMPGWRAPVVALTVGRDGTVWMVMQPEVGATQMRYQALGPTGAPIGTVTVPKTTRFLDVTRDHVLAVEEDADGLQSVVRYRLKP